MFGVTIISIVYLPILTLTGIEGKMFGPMALTVLFALIGSLVLAVTLIPVLASLFLPGRLEEREIRLLGWVRKHYEPALQRTLRRPRLALGAGMGLFAAALLVAPFLGAEFVPRLDEGALALQAWRLPSVALEESIRQTGEIERALRQFPEVTSVVLERIRPGGAESRWGSSRHPRHAPAPRGVADGEGQRRAHRGDGLGPACQSTRHIIQLLPTHRAPRQRVDTGVRSDVAFKIYGDDLATLERTAAAAVRVLSRIPRGPPTSRPSRPGACPCCGCASIGGPWRGTASMSLTPWTR